MSNFKDKSVIISGASRGIGLGFQFLKHLSRTRTILLIIDVVEKEGKDIEIESKELLEELRQFDSSLVSKVKWLVLNKIDLIPKKKQKELKTNLEKTQDLQVYLISARQRLGTKLLMREVGYGLQKIDK